MRKHLEDTSYGDATDVDSAMEKPAKRQKRLQRSRTLKARTKNRLTPSKKHVVEDAGVNGIEEDGLPDHQYDINWDVTSDGLQVLKGVELINRIASHLELSELLITSEA